MPAGLAQLRLLREAGQFAQARMVGEAWGRRFPDNQALAVARARVAVMEGQPDQGLAILQAPRAAAPRNGVMEAAYVSMLSRAGRTEEAEQACAQALDGLPGDLGLLAEHTRMAMRREDWDQALSRAEGAIRARPDEPMLQAMLARVRTQSAPADEE